MEKYVHNDNIKYANTIGFVLINIMIIQVITGIFLATLYTASTDQAFISVVYINKEINFGYILKNIHTNNTTFIFLALLIHKIKAIKENIYAHNVNTFYSG